MMLCTVPAPNKQLQRAVRDKVPSHMRHYAAAELRRYAGADAIPVRMPMGAIGVRFLLIL